MGEKDHENWKYVERWAQNLLDNCLPAAGGGGAIVDYGQLYFTTFLPGFQEIYTEGTVTSTISGTAIGQGLLTTGKAGVWHVAVHVKSGFADYTTIPAIGWVEVTASNGVSGDFRLGAACSGLYEVDEILYIEGSGAIDMNLAANSTVKVTNFMSQYCDGTAGAVNDTDIWLTIHYIGPVPDET
jgi:hypothetical protein